MNAMDILGELLGHKTSKPGRGTDALQDIFRRGSKKSTSSSSKTPGNISREAKELEDLLNVARDRSSHRKTESSQSNRARNTESFPQKRSSPTPRNTKPKPFPEHRSSPTSRDTNVGRNQDPDNERAIVLIRAMVNAAKADGKIDQAEQNKIIEKLGNSSRENIDFLRKEFSQPLDIQQFVQSVPIGMEQQVYTISLIAIDLDEGSEASYVLQLAQGLRIPLDVREQIHQRLGVPSVY